MSSNDFDTPAPGGRPAVRSVPSASGPGDVPFSSSSEARVTERILGDRRHGLAATTAASRVDTVDPRFTAEFWDRRYGAATRFWSGRPNAQLVTETEGLDPAAALDVGCGEGADANWLAERGWHVTATDISSVALARAAAHTSPEFGDRIVWLQADLHTWIPGHSYDLISAQYMQLPRALRERVFSRLADAVAPGGTLLIVGHQPDDPYGGPHEVAEPDMFFTPDEIVAGLDAERWLIHTQVIRPRIATDADGNAITVRDSIVRAQRRQETCGEHQ
jgi:SAM-dependent methyltransferase